MQTTDHTHGNGAPPGPEFPTRILVAEDNPFNRKMAEMMLTRSGFEVELAGTGQEAVDKYTADPDRFHFILMDIQMPEMDGVAATRTIRERGDAPTFRRLEAGTTPAGHPPAGCRRGRLRSQGPPWISIAISIAISLPAPHPLEAGTTNG